MKKVTLVIVGIIVVIITIALCGGTVSRRLSAERKTSQTDTVDIKPPSMSLDKNPDPAKGQSAPSGVDLTINLQQIFQGTTSSKDDTVLSIPAAEIKDGIWLPLAVLAINIAAVAFFIMRTRR